MILFIVINESFAFFKYYPSIAIAKFLAFSDFTINPQDIFCSSLTLFISFFFFEFYSYSKDPKTLIFDSFNKTYISFL